MTNKEVAIEKFTSYMKSKPESVFAVFTHVDGKHLSTDYMIRLALALRYGKPLQEMPSHCGVIWVEDGELWYWHQTWPVFRKEKWRYRAYNHFIEIDTPDVVQYAKETAREMESSAVGYAIGTLINFAWTLWCRMKRNTVLIGEVCSSALALILPSLILPEDDPYEYTHSDIDPYEAMFRLSIMGFNQFLVKK